VGWLDRLRRLPPIVPLTIAAVLTVVAVSAGVLLLGQHKATSSTVARSTPTPSGAQLSPAASATSSPSGCGPAPAGGFPGTQLAASYPVALAWSADGRLFWAERAGAVKVYEGGTVHTFATVSTVTAERGGGYSERGLLGLAVSGASVFAFYSNTDYATQTIVRWTDCAGVAKDEAVIASGLPGGSDCCHKGGRLAIDPLDGTLFASIGENHDAPAAQATTDLRGKVIRLSPDGSGRTIWTAGLRNPFGLAFAPDGTLALTNNGPSSDAGTPCASCGDEFDVVGKSPGVDYQWPYCWGYSHPIGGSGGCHNLPGPQYSTEGGPYARSSPFFVAPTGVTWSTNEYAGHFLFCAFSTQHLYEYAGQSSVVDTGVGGCQLDVKQGPDKALYTSDTTAIYRH
jgi:glucose/arabinose dehydrogenase